MRRVLATFLVARRRRRAGGLRDGRRQRRRHAALLGRARQRLRAGQGRRREDRRRARGHDRRAEGRHAHAPRAGRDQDHQDRLRVAADRRDLPGPPAVADRRVLPGLPARHVAHRAAGPARRSRSRGRRRWSHPTSSTTCCACPTASASASSSTSWAPPSPATPRTSTPRSAAPRPACERPTRSSRSWPTRTRSSPTWSRNADKVIGDMSDNRKEVARWVVEARDTARASAERRGDIAAWLPRAPGLPRAARADDARRSATSPTSRRPALQTLSSAAPRAQDASSTELAPFADASRPAFRALGRGVGDRAQGRRRRHPDRRASSSKFADGHAGAGQEPRDRSSSTSTTATTRSRPTRAARAARATPGSRRCSSTSTTRRCRSTSTTRARHILKVSPFVSDCAQLRRRPAGQGQRPAGRPARATLGPNQPGINFPDGPSPRARRQARRETRAALHRPREVPVPRRGAADRGRLEAAQEGPTPTPAHARRRDPGRAADRDPLRARRAAEGRRRRHRPGDAGQAPRLPAEAMRRRGPASIVANPVLVGAVTTLVVVVAVFLAYNANNGLPFVPTTRQIDVQVANGAELVPGNEVRAGGYRVGRRRGHGPGQAAQRQGRRDPQAQARREVRRGPGRLDGWSSGRARRWA